MAPADVPILGQLEAQFGVGLSEGVRDHIICIDGGKQVVCVIGNRVALVRSSTSDGHTPSGPDAAVEPMMFLPDTKYVRSVTAVCVDDRRKTLAVCVELDLTADIVSATAAGGGADFPSTPTVSPFQVLVYNLVGAGVTLAPKKTRTLTHDIALDGFNNTEIASGSSSRLPSSRSSIAGDSRRVPPGSALQPFVCCAFSPDGAQLVAVSAYPESRCVAWLWQKNKVAFSNRCLALEPSPAIGDGDDPQSGLLALSSRLVAPSPRSHHSFSGNSAGSFSTKRDVGVAADEASSDPSGVDNSDGGKQVKRGAAIPLPAVKVTRVRFHPWLQGVVSTSGPTHIRLWSIAKVPQVAVSSAIPVNGVTRHCPQWLVPQGMLRRQPLRERGEEFTDHVWTGDGRLAWSSDTGHVYFANGENNEFSSALRYAHGFSATGQPRSVACLAVCSGVPSSSGGGVGSSSRSGVEDIKNAPLHAMGYPLDGGFRAGRLLLTGGSDGVVGVLEPEGNRLHPYAVQSLCATSPKGAAVTCLALDPTAPTHLPADTNTQAVLVVAHRGGLGVLEVGDLRGESKGAGANKQRGQQTQHLNYPGSSDGAGSLIQAGDEGSNATMPGVVGATRDDRANDDGSDEKEGDQGIMRNDDVDDMLLDSSDDGVNSMGSLLTNLSLDRSPHGVSKCFASKVSGRMGDGWHTGPVDALSVCAGGGRSVFATCCSSDASVRLWDFKLGKCVLRHSFAGSYNSTPRSVSISPSGHKLLVGFDDLVQLFHVVEGGVLLLAHSEVVKGVVSMKGTQGGGGKAPAAAAAASGSGVDGEPSFSSLPSTPGEGAVPGFISGGRGGAGGASSGLGWGVGTSTESCLVADKVSAVAFHRNGSSFAVLTGKTLQVFLLHSPQHGGCPGRVGVLAGHSCDISAWAWSPEERRVFTAAQEDGSLFRWDGVGDRAQVGSVLKRAKDVVRPELGYLALAATEDGALVASAYTKMGGPLDNSSQRDNLSGDVDDDYGGDADDDNLDADPSEGGGIIGVPNLKGPSSRFAAPSSLARQGTPRVPSGAPSAATTNAEAKMLRQRTALRKMSSSSLRTQAGPVLDSSAQEDTSTASLAWQMSHATLTVWPTAEVEGGRLEASLPAGVGALTSLCVSSGGHGGRAGVPSCLLGGGLKGALVALPWPLFDSEACALALSLGEAASVCPPAPQPATTAAAVAAAAAAGPSLEAPLSVAMHSAKVTHLCLTPEGNACISAAEDGSVFVTLLKRRGRGGQLLRAAATAVIAKSVTAAAVASSRMRDSDAHCGLSACAELKTSQPTDVVWDGQLVVVEASAASAQRVQLSELARLLRESGAKLKFEQRSASKRLKDALAGCEAERGRDVRELEKALESLKSKLSEAQSGQAAHAARQEREFGQAADDLQLAYEKKLEHAALEVQKWQECSGHASREKEEKVGGLEAQMALQVEAHSLQLGEERERVAGEQAVMRQYCEYARKKYDAAMDQDEDLHALQIATLEHKQTSAFQKAVRDLGDARAERATFERKNRDLNEASLGLQDEALRAQDEVRSARADVSRLTEELTARDALLEAERTKSAEWEAEAARVAREVRVLEKTKRVREHELHEMRTEAPVKEQEVAAARAKLDLLNGAFEEEALKRGERERKAKAAADKAAWVEGKWKASEEREKRQTRALGKVAEQLGTLVDAQAHPDSKRVLDLGAWVCELTQLHEFVKPLLGGGAGGGNSKFEASSFRSLDLVAKEQEGRLRQQTLQEGQLEAMKKRLAVKDVEGKAAASRLREHNEDLLQSVAELKKSLSKAEGKLKDANSEVAFLKDKGAAWRNGKQQAPLSSGDNGGVGTPVGVGGFGNHPSPPPSIGSSPRPFKASSHGIGSGNSHASSNFVHGVGGLGTSAKLTASEIRPPPVVATFRIPTINSSGGGGGGKLWPRPSDKRDRSVSSGMVPSNVTRSAGLSVLSKAARKREGKVSAEREARLEQSSSLLTRESQTYAALVGLLEGELAAHLGKGGAAAVVHGAREALLLQGRTGVASVGAYGVCGGGFVGGGDTMMPSLTSLEEQFRDAALSATQEQTQRHVEQQATNKNIAGDGLGIGLNTSTMSTSSLPAMMGI